MGQHVLVINRFDNEHGEYDRYLDHSAYRVAYLASEAGTGPLIPELAEAIEVVDLADHGQVQARARQLADRFGRFDLVVTLSEFDLELGAEIREALDVPGPRPADVRRVRDKVVMKTLVGAAGLRVPRFVLASSPQVVRDFAGQVGFPVVLKPRAGWDSQGVFLVRSAASLEDVLAGQRLDDYECEEFVAGQMYHVDGVVRDGEVLVMRSSRLLATCLDFALGTPFGSVANDEPDLERRLRSYAGRVVGALGLRTGAFHLEVFRTGPAGPGEHDDLVFLEIGGRVGGAQIPFVWRQVYGVDLMETWVRLSAGEDPQLPEVGVHTEAGGYLMMPEPPARPCRVLAVRSLQGTVPALYAELLPVPGTVLDGTGGARETGGNYRFRAAGSAEIEAAIQQVVAEYRIEWEPLAEEGPHERSQGRMQAVACP
jgi:hypothetical protein